MAVVAGFALVVGACTGSDSAAGSGGEAAGAVEGESQDGTGGTQDGEADEAAEEFIDLPYWDTHLIDRLDLDIAPPEECDESDPARQVCDFEVSHVFISSLFGEATAQVAGTRTVEFSSCADADGTAGDLTVLEGQGTITTAWGDEAYFTSVSGGCSVTNAGAQPSTWRVTGGTGRFEGASGLMTGSNAVLGSPPDVVHVRDLSTGTLRVRADLWDELLPAE